MNRRTWTELGGVALIVSALAVAVFWPAFDPDQGDVVGRYDVHRQFGPWNYFFDRSLHAGDFPEWNPLVFSGAPHAANPQSWALYPPNLVRALLHAEPTPLGTLRGLSALMGMHLLLWALGVYQLARVHELSRDSALLAAIVASFSALMVRRIGEYHFIFTLAWLPWMLLALHGLLASQRPPEAKLRAGVGPAVALAMLFASSVLGGFLQIVPHLVIAMAAYLVAELARSNTPPGDRRRLWLHAIALAGAAGLLAVGLASLLLVPASELLSHSPRASGSGVDVGGHKPEAWNLAYAARSLLVYCGRIFEPETLRGAGIIALALAFASLAQRSWRRILPFVSILYAMMDMMLGRPWPLSSLIYALSPVQLVSGTRAFDVAMLPLAILAGFGLENLRRTRFAAALVASAVTIAGIVVLRRMMDSGVMWLAPDASVWLVPLAFLAVLLLWLAWPTRAVVWGALTLLLLTGELLTWNRFFAPPMLVRRGFDADWKARDGFSGSEPLWPHNRRETTDRENFSIFSLRGISNGYDPLHLRSYREAVSGRVKPRYRRTLRERETVSDTPRGHLFLKRAFWLVPGVVQGAMPQGQGMFPPTEVAFVAGAVPPGIAMRAASSIPDLPYSAHTRSIPLSMRRRTPSLFVAETPTLARAHHALVVHLTPGRDGEVELSTRFREHGGGRHIPGYTRKIDARANEPLELALPMPDMQQSAIELQVKPGDGSVALDGLELRQDLADEDSSIHIDERSADRIDVRVDKLPAARLLAFIDNDYPGWAASVDGKPAALVRVNDSFKGVWLEPGSHRVRFEFVSSSLRKGVWISLVTLLTCLGLLAWRHAGRLLRRASASS